MPNVTLYPYQIDAVNRMKNGCILAGGVGTGKSRTSLAYIYTKVLHGTLKVNGKGVWTPPSNPKDIFIITTAKKRDSKEWELELGPFGLSSDPKLSTRGIKVTVDSWNNIKKYTKIHGAVFIFDEDRVVGSGTWVKAFLNISRKNEWILLSATPGDQWKDYIPVFVANGFYKNRSEFNAKHVVLKPFRNYPIIDHYKNTHLLNEHRRDILVTMEPPKKNVRVKHDVVCEYDVKKYKMIFKSRWDPYDDCPIEETGKLCYLLRRVTNEDKSRIEALKDILKTKDKAIIFYNFTSELDILRQVAKDLKFTVGEWNGENHNPVPTTKRWVYLCQYTAASEGWNCITTDTIIFYSLNYSYKTMVQASGRIDRLNTPFKELHYYYLRSRSPIDVAIKRALALKKKFNENDFIKSGGK